MSHPLTGTAAYPLPTTTVPDDGDDANAASVEVGFQSHEDAIATLAARLGGKTTGLTTEWAYPSAKGRSTRIPAVGGDALPVYVPPGGAAMAATTGAWKPHYTNAAGAGPGGRDLITTTGKVYTSYTLHTYVRALERMIMPGGTIVTVEVRVTKGSAQATSTDRMAWELFKVSMTGTRTSLASGTSDATSGDETISVTLGTPEVVDPTVMYYLAVTSSAGAGSGTEDYFLGANINWTDPGPRN